jgi:hypothetical protein
MKSLGVTVSVFLIALFLPSVTNATAAPKFGYTIPAGADLGELIKASQECGIEDKVVLLPPWQLNLAGDDDANSQGEIQGKILVALPAEAEAYLRLQVRAGGLTGKESEAALTARIAGFLAGIPLNNGKVRGLIVEVEESAPATNMFSFALVNIAVKAKGSKPGLQLDFMFPGGFIPKHGDLIKRLAFYSDQLGTAYGPDWQGDSNWIASQALNKPVRQSRTSGGSVFERGARRQRYVCGADVGRNEECSRVARCLHGGKIFLADRDQGIQSHPFHGRGVQGNGGGRCDCRGQMVC